MRNATRDVGTVMVRGMRIGRYYERGIIAVCGVGARRTGLRGSIYSGRMALRRYTTIIIRSYWIIALHLAIPRERTYVVPQVFPKRCIPGSSRRLRLPSNCTDITSAAD